MRRLINVVELTIGFFNINNNWHHRCSYIWMMNSPKDFEEDFLSCLICFEKFNNPKTLPCLHTFCLDCLRSYIKSTTLFKNGTSFKCPTCRDLATVPRPKSPDWAAQFKTNFYVNNLMEAAAAANTAPQKTLVSCGDSKSLSNKIVPIMKTELAAHKSKLEPYLLRLELLNIEIEKEQTNAATEKERIKNLIMAHSKQLLRMVQNETTRCLGRLDSISLEIDDVFQSEIESNKRLRSSVESTCSDMDTVINGSDANILDGVERIVGEKQKLMHKLPTSFQIPVFKINHVPADLKICGILGTTDFGREKRILMFADAKIPKYSDSNNSSIDSVPHLNPGEISNGSPYFNHKSTLTFLSKLETKVKGDKSNPCLRDIALLQSGIVVVTDSGNNCIKSFYNITGTKKDSSRISTGLPPHAVSVMNTENRVAVTVPKAKQIMVINVAPNLALEKHITTTKKYWGISGIGRGMFAVSTCPGIEAGVIDIINLEGDLLQNIHSTGLFPNPLYLASLSTGVIIVSDCTVQKVAGLRQNGDVLFGKDKRNDIFIRPMGVKCDSFDGILIVDANQNVFAMNGRGIVKKKFSLHCKDIKKEVIRSLAVHKNKLYVVSEESRIFTFQLQ
ncbi:tripartite motif-containing protein 59-like [Patella vulgata]|uniref:tripartite motif-containing protein 59-like n=1 Tax=Patella vulgata TaxID=6465 RepID=UPI0021803190|nr:tripartite motif-containing protein 59-like [Patella vulgata]